MEKGCLSDTSGLNDAFSDSTRARILQLFQYGQVGHCVNSVAHDLNNYLGAILAYAELIELDPNLSPDASRMTGEIIQAVKKSSHLLGVLTEIARKETPTPTLVEPGALIRRVLDLKHYEIKAAQIPLETGLECGAARVALDQPKMERALACLLINAVEALDGARERLVRVSIQDADEAIEIVFWNSGAAVPEPQRDLIFQPFFTTKGGDHLGLGLPVARDIARFHNGDLFYDADRGFVMRLPKDKRSRGHHRPE